MSNSNSRGGAQAGSDLAAASGLQAVITAVEANYVVARLRQHHPEISGSVTFDFESWRSQDRPKPGQVVNLEGIHLFEHGWRASSATPVLVSQQEVADENN